jgi:pyridinium-3,5-biscarboxylic acid mononucleotide sulfurtransferase
MRAPSSPHEIIMATSTEPQSAQTTAALPERAEPFDVEATIDQIVQTIAGFGRVVVAFSGGVDSSLVAALARRALGVDALAVTAVSPALATGELDGARHVAATIGVAHEVITTDEMARAGYRDNGPDRCYHCKSELYDNLVILASSRGFTTVLSGANADDQGDWRPGLVAAEEHNVRHPLLEARITKDMVRAMAAHLGVPSATKPASPCLASRVPHGTPVDPVLLAQVDRAEQALHALGLGELRVRHYGDLAKVELNEHDLQKASAMDEQKRISDAVKLAGYRHVAIDLEPFRSGNLTVHLLMPTVRRKPLTD